MAERTIALSDVNPLDLYGVNDQKLEAIKAQFPKVKIVARGRNIKAMGSESELDFFEKKLATLLQHLDRFKQLNLGDIEQLLINDAEDLVNEPKASDEVLVYGNNGILVKAKTVNQRKLVKNVDKYDMVFAIGPAGTGKTYTAVALAARALKNKEVRRIILTRPAVEAGENLGFLPGDLKEKLDPFLQPLYDALHDMFPAERLRDYMENGIVQIAPLAFMRGRTLDNAFVILDEAQNATKSQFKMFLTRMGKNAKFCINGDASQIDLPKHQPSGLLQAMDILKKTKGIGFVHFDGKDVIRHDLVRRIIDAYDMIEKNNELNTPKPNDKK
ncbi:MAG: PhoH family protein [Vicingaceae bacterium]